MKSSPCRNLQTVLDRATNGADIYVTSDILSLDAVHDNVSHVDHDHACCLILSSLTYTINSLEGKGFRLNCSGELSCMNSALNVLKMVLGLVY